jgi:hypothetical protein
MAATAVPFLAFAGWQWVSGVAAGGAPDVDFLLYRDATARWLAGGGFYAPWQLAGPYDVWTTPGAILYPPPILVLLVPFTVLPAPLWSALPLAIVMCVVVWHRPHPSAWPILAMGLAWIATPQAIAHGNPVLWAWAALALGTLWGWPAVLVLLKPSLAPFALIGATRRSWWIGLGALVGASLLLLPLWIDWVRAVVDSRGTGLLYSAKELPMMLIPLVAWAARTPRQPHTSIRSVTAPRDAPRPPA